MSDTPRTDALDCDMLKEWGNISYLHMRTHAERLERELAAMTKERDEWKAKAEANERDAGRYRYLRDKEDGDMFMENVGEDLDRAIDAARSAEKEKE